MNNDVNCPYCNHPQDINHDDGYGYEESTAHQQQCCKCNKTFVFHTQISFDYDVAKADCLNDGEHDWQPTRTIPERYKKMQCSLCDEEREPTPEERELFKIPNF